MAESNKKGFNQNSYIKTFIQGFKDSTIQLELQLYKVKARKDELKVPACYQNPFKYYMEINYQRKTRN